MACVDKEALMAEAAKAGAEAAKGTIQTTVDTAVESAQFFAFNGIGVIAVLFVIIVGGIFAVRLLMRQN
jgi:hypothetical protein